MVNNVLITMEIANIAQMEREAEERERQIVKISELIEILWSAMPFDFENGISILETAQYFKLPVVDIIEAELKEINPASWARYKKSLKPDVSCADGKTDER